MYAPGHRWIRPCPKNASLNAHREQRPRPAPQRLAIQVLLDTPNRRLTAWPLTGIYNSWNGCARGAGWKPLGDARIFWGGKAKRTAKQCAFLGPPLRFTDPPDLSFSSSSSIPHQFSKIVRQGRYCSREFTCSSGYRGRRLVCSVSDTCVASGPAPWTTKAKFFTLLKNKECRPIVCRRGKNRAGEESPHSCSSLRGLTASALKEEEEEAEEVFEEGRGTFSSGFKTPGTTTRGTTHGMWVVRSETGRYDKSR